MLERRALPIAPWLLAASVVGGLLLLLQGDHQAMFDLRVYHDAPPTLLTDRLYEFTYSEFTPDFPLPFTYPPFAALVLLPLSALPWLLARVVWYTGLLLCVWYLVRTSFRLVAGPRWEGERARWQRWAMLTTAVLLWAEPIRSNFYFGQINLPLAALLMAGMLSARSALAGASVGLAAGVKLTPAVSGLYFLVTRRWAAAAWSAAVFAGTVGLGWLVSADQSRRFWFELLGDAGRVGPVGSAINQSLRGALSRTLGHDVGMGAPWIVAVVVVSGLTAFALWSAARAGDTLATLVTVQVFGLLVSPISWMHHWVWLLPAVVWLMFGPRRRQAWAWAALGAWLVALFSYVISKLLQAQPSIWVIPRPWYLSALGWVYPACAVLTLVAVALAVRPLATEPAGAPVPRRRGLPTRGPALG
ncbi:mannosyltransferase [Streptoalloteichus tenebrarius]|uniref:mannosyltransferase n=1 Tax=Streptoalloteichus tenebrarius (strain ATCC 17920 / DSM 40477 / JCM 4838 / CBS 697.72 / NBRC 16177 / NCIMB 11028 / NRRL B-12390 / A12253. 1 / ISP 5477) TaxID=1933 RepID=UPI0020A570D3|nr:mannosyltransferase [Streptoalloteichus tenebrarius]BFF01112.1 mannosyltransferase [Streptoalloteichus tenebrarius]